MTADLMYEQLKSRVAELLTRPRPLLPQSERQLSHHLQEHEADLASFLLEAADLLEDHDLDIVFSPQFTPGLDDQAAVSDLLYHWRPSHAELARLVTDLCGSVSHGVVQISDGTEAKLTLHEVMVERFVRLLRLDQGPDPQVSATLREALPSDLWPIAGALVRQRGFTPSRQAWFAGFVNHLVSEKTIDRGLLRTTAEFIADQPNLDRDSLIDAARALARAAEGSAAYARGGRTCWSLDVAQHHQYRGQGEVDESLVKQREAEVEWLEIIESTLRTFEDPASA